MKCKIQWVCKDREGCWNPTPDTNDAVQLALVHKAQRDANGEVIGYTVPIINTYVPQGYAIDSEKYAFKLDWFRRLRTYFEKELDPEKPAIWMGDLNVAPEPIDAHHPDRRVNDPDFHIDAKKRLQGHCRLGVHRRLSKLHPDVVQYTYWDYYRNAVERNFGWRIDHIRQPSLSPKNALERKSIWPRGRSKGLQTTPSFGRNSSECFRWHAGHPMSAFTVSIVSASSARLSVRHRAMRGKRTATPDL